MLVAEPLVCDRLADMAREVQHSSFIDFWSRFEFKSAGRPSKSQNKKKAKNKIVELTKPLVAVPKPAVALAWSKPGHTSRPWYCECMLKRHKPFICEEAFNSFMVQHNHNFEDAFQTFACGSDAPQCVKDAFAKWVQQCLHRHAHCCCAQAQQLECNHGRPGG